MKDRPILFSAPMVRALLDGSKTQTRRVAKLTDAAHVKEVGGHRRWHPADPNAALACPYGQPGDQLWVRETFYEEFGRPPLNDEERQEWLVNGFLDYRASNDQQPYGSGGALAWKPSIHMPRWASRITLEIVGVRVERLQDISEADAIAEGCTMNNNGYYRGGPHKVSGLKQMATAVSAYRDLWESINGPTSWDANPWVWVVDFKVAKP